MFRTNQNKIILALTTFIVLALFAFSNSNILQTRIGHIWFHSKTSLQELEAHNYQVSSALNTVTGDIAFSVLIKSFEFDKILMEKHFNENYLESEKFPNALFKGNITDISKVNFSKPGSYPVNVQGDMTLHGVTNHITNNGVITVTGTSVTAKSQIPIRLVDYKINVPQLMKEKIAEIIEVNVDVKYNTQK
jgi:polyisoprenoid-binding protein YceI